MSIIAKLNDAFRTHPNWDGGFYVITRGVLNLSADAQAEIYKKVRQFSDFNEDNDPNGEHDFGSFDVQGMRIFWKIDYYDEKCIWRSEDPEDPSKTTRVLTVMLASEY